MNQQPKRKINPRHSQAKGLVAAWTPEGEIEVPGEPLSPEVRALIALTNPRLLEYILPGADS